MYSTALIFPFSQEKKDVIKIAQDVLLVGNIEKTEVY